MKHNRSFYLMLALLPALFLTGSILAQTSGKIAGQVRDAQTGEALPGANVLIEGTTLGAASDTDGAFMILRIPPGKHTVTVGYIGYRRVVMNEVEVLTDLTTELDFRLEPEAFAGDEVVIRAERPLVRRDLTSAEARVQAEQIQAMAVQEVGQLLDLQAGIVRDENGGIHIRGGRTSEVAYLVNGISVTDDYSCQQALTVENESIQELQVISGTFNAEYGNAMSGVINIVTKTGGNDFSAKVETWLGDYISGRTDLFWNIDDLDPLAFNNVQASLSGPIIRDRLTYFVTARRLQTDGWLYGPAAFSPQGRWQSVDGLLTPLRGDSSAVSMNSGERWSGQGTLQYRSSGPLTLRLDFLGSQYDGKNYNHSYRLNPEGDNSFLGYGLTSISKLTHVLNPKNFYELIVSYKFNENKSQLYKDSDDTRYVHPDSLSAAQYSFFKAGTNLFRSNRSTASIIAKLDFTSQVTRHHQVKSGAEIQTDRIRFNDLTLIPATDASGRQITPFRPAIPDVSSSGHNRFTRRPRKAALYVQDKIELESVVINAGLRFDYFHSRGKVPRDPQDPNIYLPLKLDHIYKDTNSDGSINLDEQIAVNEYTLAERQEFWYDDVQARSLLSPRFGIAYPITARGVIHFSYGIFQQIPEYSLLYYNDELKTPEGQGIYGPYGNPGLNPQRTTMYELGLKQQLAANLGIDLTAYYRDIRDWISTSPQIMTYSTGVSYVKNINRDQANVKGVSLTLTRQLAGHFGFDLNYTYQIVKGTNSSPEDEYFALTSGVEPRKQLSPLGWDQRHAFNFSLIYGGKSWGGNVITRLQTGQPYTPEVVSGVRTGQNVLSGLATNSRNKPARFSIDLTAFKRFELRGYGLEFFIAVYNLLDFKNPEQIYADSGKPDYTVYEQSAAEADPTWFNRPDFYAEPRRIQVGTRIGF